MLRIAVNPPDSLLAQMREDKRGLLRAVRRCLPDDPKIELVLVHRSIRRSLHAGRQTKPNARSCSTAWSTAVLDERSRVRVIVTLRADFIDRPLRYVDFGELLQRRSELVLPLTPDEIGARHRRPGRARGAATRSRPGAKPSCAMWAINPARCRCCNMR